MEVMIKECRGRHTGTCKNRMRKMKDGECFARTTEARSGGESDNKKEPTSTWRITIRAPKHGEVN